MTDTELLTLIVLDKVTNNDFQQYTQDWNKALELMNTHKKTLKELGIHVNGDGNTFGNQRDNLRYTLSWVGHTSHRAYELIYWGSGAVVNDRH